MDEINVGSVNQPPSQEISTPSTPPFPNDNQPSDLQPKKKKVWIPIILGTIFIIGLLYIGSVFYLSNKEKYYSDPKYEFKILSQSGWEKPSIETDVAYSLGTPDSTGKNVVSSFNVNPMLRSDTGEFSLETFRGFCKDTAADGGYLDYNVTQTRVNDLSGYLCEYERNPTNVDMLYKFRIYYLVNKQGKKYDYILSVSYPKGDLGEEEKVNKIIGDFYPI